MKAVSTTLAILLSAAAAAPADIEARQAPPPTDSKKYIELHSFKWTRNGNAVTAMDFGASIHDTPFKSAQCSTSFDRSGEPFAQVKVHRCRPDGAFTWNWEANTMRVWYTSDTKSFHGTGSISPSQFNLFLTLSEIEPTP